MFSERSGLSEDEPTALDTALAARRARGEPVLDLRSTDVDFARVDELVRDALHQPPGDPHAAIARRLETDGASIDPAHVVIAAGRRDAYARLLWLLCDPGDEVLVPQPRYPGLEQCAHDGGVALAPYPLALGAEWRLDPAAIWDAIGERARAIVIESPGVAGSYVRPDALEALAALELPLIVDESWAAYPLEAPAERARARDATMFTIDGPCALPALQLAWIGVSGPAARTREALERLARARAPVAAHVARALPALLMREPRRAILDRAERNLATLRALVRGTSVAMPRVEGGWHAWLRLPAGASDEGWAMRALDRGVLVAPGGAFDAASDRWLAVSLLTPPDELARGAAILAEMAGTRQ